MPKPIPTTSGNNSICCEKCLNIKTTWPTCLNSACDCHKMFCVNSSDAIEKVLGEFEKEFHDSFHSFRGKEYKLGPYSKKMVVTPGPDEKKVTNFLKSALEEAYDTSRKEAIEERDAMWLELLKNSHPQVLVQLQGEIALKAKLREIK